MVDLVQKHGSKAFENSQHNRCDCATEEEAKQPDIIEEIKNATTLRSILERNKKTANLDMNILRSFPIPIINLKCETCADRNINYTERAQNLKSMDDSATRLLANGRASRYRD